MKQVEEWIKEKGHDYIEHKEDGFQYLFLPFCVFFKNDEKNYISFDIEEDKSFCLEFYADIQGDLLGKVNIDIYYDCFFGINESGEVENLTFGDDARCNYYSFIKEAIKNDVKMPKNVVFN